MTNPNQTAVAKASQLTALLNALPARIRAAAYAVSVAEQSLANLLTRQDAGWPVKAAEIAGARKALALARQDQEDVRLIETVLPGLTEEAREAARTENALRTAAVRGEAGKAFDEALAALKNRRFIGLSRSEIKELGVRVRELASKAGRVQEYKEAVTTDLCNKPNGDVLLEQL